MLTHRYGLWGVAERALARTRNPRALSSRTARLPRGVGSGRRVRSVRRPHRRRPLCVRGRSSRAARGGARMSAPRETHKCATAPSAPPTTRVSYTGGCREFQRQDHAPLTGHRVVCRARTQGTERRPPRRSRSWRGVRWEGGGGRRAAPRRSAFLTLGCGDGRDAAAGVAS